MAFPFVSLFSTIGSVFKGIFGAKEKQADVIDKAIGTIGDVTRSDADRAAAGAEAIKALYQHGSPYEKNLRPTMGYICMVLIIARWFGYSPPGMGEAELMWIYSTMNIVMTGYIAARSLDKWMMGFHIGKILTKFVEKKL